MPDEPTTWPLYHRFPAPDAEPAAGPPEDEPAEAPEETTPS